MGSLFRSGCQREKKTHKVTDTQKKNAEALLETRARGMRYTIRPHRLRRAKRDVRHGERCSEMVFNEKKKHKVTDVP